MGPYKGSLRTVGREAMMEVGEGGLLEEEEKEGRLVPTRRRPIPVNPGPGDPVGNVRNVVKMR